MGINLSETFDGAREKIQQSLSLILILLEKHR